MSLYDNARSDDLPKKPIEVLNDRVDTVTNKFIDINLAIAALTKRVDDLEASAKAKRRAVVPATEVLDVPQS